MPTTLNMPPPYVAGRHARRHVSVMRVSQSGSFAAARPQQPARPATAVTGSVTGASCERHTGVMRASRRPWSGHAAASPAFLVHSVRPLRLRATCTPYGRFRPRSRCTPVRPLRPRATCIPYGRFRPRSRCVPCGRFARVPGARCRRSPQEDSLLNSSASERQPAGVG